MKCPKCQFENPSDSKFCKECGTQVISSEKISPSHTKTLETPKEEFTRGTTFAERYDFIEELGTRGMGHSTVKITERYTHSNRGERKKAVELLCRKPFKMFQRPKNLLHICDIEDKKDKSVIVSSLFSVN